MAARGALSRRGCAQPWAWRRGALGTVVRRLSTGGDEATVSPTRTSATAELWRLRRQKDLDQAKTVQDSEVSVEMPTFLLDKSPAESFLEVPLRFKSDALVRGQYESFQQGRVRMGKILEDLDAFAGNVAHSHADDNNPRTRPLQIVTACVDRMDVRRSVTPERDLVMNGCISWVGRSSMQVQVCICDEGGHEGRSDPLLRSTFLMVARDGTSGKSAPVNRLVPQTAAEEAAFREGAELMARKKHEQKAALSAKPPTSEEAAHVHALFFGEAATGSAKRVPIASTALESTTLCQPQERNTGDKIFGGYLMRKAFELGMSAAYRLFGANSAPFLLAVDDINFLRPVEIGSIVRFQARVVYSSSRAIQVQVETKVQDLVNCTSHTSNTFWFTFSNLSGAAVPAVMPETYLETIAFVEGMRRLQGSRASAEAAGSSLVEHFG